MPVLNKATILYCKTKDAVFSYNSRERKEWTVDAAVDKATAKSWNKQYPKQKAKEVDTEDFKEQYLIDPPFPNQDEQYIIKFKKKADYVKNGDIIQIADQYRPRVFEKGDDGKLVDITMAKLVANGSVGTIQFEEVSNDYGTFAQLKAIRVDELIEYKSGGASFDELGELGDEGLAEVATESKETPRQAQASKEQDSQGGFDDFDSEIPF